MTRYVLNSPVLTDYGRWRFDGPLPLQAARDFAAQGLQSAIGHAGAAQWLSSCLGVPVACDRRKVQMQPGDEALVLRLLHRLPEGGVLDADALATAQPEFGLLTREA